MKDKRTLQHGTTLVELTVAVAVVAIVFGALMPLFAGVRNSSESRWAGLEMVQNARVLNEQLSRHLAQARKVVSVSGPSTANGHIEFEAVNGAVLRCEVGSNGYVRFGSADDLAELAGPVKSLKFVCYDANDLESPTEIPAYVRLVTWEAAFESSARLMQGRSVMGASFLRANARVIWDTIATTYDYANRQQGVDVFAFAAEGKPQVPTEPDVPSTLLSSEEYDAIELDDGDFHVLEVVSEADFAQLRCAFLIDEDERDIVRITGAWNGIGINAHEARKDGASLYIWNDQLAEYELLAVSGDTELEVTAVGSARGPAGDYIGGPDENMILLLVVLNDKKTGERVARLLTDHVKLEVAMRVESGAPMP